MLHTSDLHGRYKVVLGVTEPFDVWVDTGDFFPNRGRVPSTGFRIAHAAEHRYQHRWLELKDLLRRLTAWLDGRPMLCVPGNHDFLRLAPRLRAAGADAHEVTPDGLELLGHTWAGFREIPPLIGEWPGECQDFGPLVDRVWAAYPDILVTHAPPLGILDGPERTGVEALRGALFGRTHRVGLHLFGHEHADGGRTDVVDGVRFHNGAEHVGWIDLPQV